MSDQELETRAKLLQAAGEVFAEHGFHSATVRDICHRAGANIAAVNYHFGGKESLYRALLEYSFAEAQRKYPVVLPGDATSERKLEIFIATSLERMLDESKASWHGRLMMREMTEPTGQLEAIAESYMRPHFAMLAGILRELVGDKASARRIELLCLSTMGQLVFYKTCGSAIRCVTPHQGTGPEDRKEIAAHVASIILAACRAIRAEYQEDHA